MASSSVRLYTAPLDLDPFGKEAIRAANPAFDEFMNKHGQHFPENPKNVDELLDSLAERAAAAQRLRNSLTPEQRAELDALAQQAFGDSNLLDQLDQLDQNLQQARPGEDWDGSQNFRGENGMGLGDGTGALQDIADLENLGHQLSQQYNGAALDDIDADAVGQEPLTYEGL